MTRVAISHDWLLNSRGAERVLCELCSVFEGARIYTLFLDPGAVPPRILRHKIEVSILDALPGVSHYYRLLLPAFHWAAGRLQINSADVILSISHSVAKAVNHPPDIPHVCYCLTPMRYIWEPRLYGTMMENSVRGKLLGLVSDRIRRKDLASNEGVDHFVAISKTIQHRILCAYGRESEVIYPCVDLDAFSPADVDREGFYLAVSALVDQKNLGLAVEAFNQSRRQLLIVGSGPLARTLQKAARPNIRFLGWLPDEQVIDLYRRARALIFPGIEDFGLVPLEAQACGCPVIALQEGGLTETVLPEETGLFFSEATPLSLNEAVDRFERKHLDPKKAVANAGRFSREVFQARWKDYFRKLGLARGS